MIEDIPELTTAKNMEIHKLVKKWHRQDHHNNITDNNFIVITTYMPLITGLVVE
jgi:hypothetical protein